MISARLGGKVVRARKLLEVGFDFICFHNGDASQKAKVAHVEVEMY